MKKIKDRKSALKKSKSTGAKKIRSTKSKNYFGKLKISPFTNFAGVGVLGIAMSTR